MPPPSIDCWPRPPTVNAGAAGGSTRPATPTATATRSTPRAASGIDHHHAGFGIGEHGRQMPPRGGHQQPRPGQVVDGDPHSAARRIQLALQMPRPLLPLALKHTERLGGSRHPNVPQRRVRFRRAEAAAIQFPLQILPVRAPALAQLVMDPQRIVVIVPPRARPVGDAVIHTRANLQRRQRQQRPCRESNPGRKTCH